MRNVFFIVLTLFFSRLNAQQVKEGMIRYNVVLECISPKTKRPDILNGEYLIYFKNGKTLSELVGTKSAIKTLNDEKELLILYDFGNGDKVFSGKTRAELKNMSEGKDRKPLNNLKVIYTKKKKMILGYECSQALISYTASNGIANSCTIWYTEKIKNLQINKIGGIPNPDITAGLKGMPLEMYMLSGEKVSKITVKEISTKPVPDTVFALSTEGYSELKPKTPVPPLHN